MPSPAKLEIDDLSMRFDTPAGGFLALDHVSLAVREGAFISLVGPSGCGKSTIFNIVAGLQEPTSGRVLIDGVEATGTIGRVGYMLQKDLLLPWRTLTDNIILGMEIQGVPLRRGARPRAAAAAPLWARRIRERLSRRRCPAACASARRCCARCCSTPT